VYAPHAKRVEIEIFNQKQNLLPQTNGYWQSSQPLPTGTLYLLFIDGKGPFPDPRSAFQPQGIFGPSCTVAHDEFHWNNTSFRAEPLERAILYELHIGTFTQQGTFLSAIERLPYLVSLGVTHLEVMPLHSFGGTRGWGYDGVNMFAPFAKYGSPDDVKRFVDACHQHNLAVLLDVVYNHLGPVGNFLGKFGPYFSQRFSTPWGKALNFDGHGSDEVREFFINNAIMWLGDYHFDGLRLDAVHMIVDQGAKHFLEELSEEVEKLSVEQNRPLLLIAESNANDPRIVRSREQGGLGLDGVWNDDFHNALHASITKEGHGYYRDIEGLSSLAHVLQNGFLLDGRYSHYYQKKHGRPYTHKTGSPLICYLQNHDQVGNRPKGERIQHIASVGLCKIGAAILLCAPFTPMLFMGEEFAASAGFYFFTDHPDENVGRNVHEGRRREFREFGWSTDETHHPQKIETFAKSILPWSDLNSPWHQDFFKWYQSLIALRRGTKSLYDGELASVEVSFDAKDEWLILRRKEIFVLCNFSKREQVLTTPADKILLSSVTANTLSNQRATLAAESVLISAC
jgi:maltooligosyltrehalose trehalohydrolase